MTTKRKPSPKGKSRETKRTWLDNSAFKPEVAAVIWQMPPGAAMMDLTSVSADADEDDYFDDYKELCVSDLKGLYGSDHVALLGEVIPTTNKKKKEDILDKILFEMFQSLRAVDMEITRKYDRYDPVKILRDIGSDASHLAAALGHAPELLTQDLSVTASRDDEILKLIERTLVLGAMKKALLDSDLPKKLVNSISTKVLTEISSSLTSELARQRLDLLASYTSRLSHWCEETKGHVVAVVKKRGTTYAALTRTIYDVGCIWEQELPGRRASVTTTDHKERPHSGEFLDFIEQLWQPLFKPGYLPRSFADLIKKGRRKFKPRGSQ